MHFDFLDKVLTPGTVGTIVITVIITSIITVIVVNSFLKRMFDFVMDILLKFIVYLMNYIYRLVAPRLPKALLLRAYREHILKSNLAKMENPVGPSLSVPLDHAFAPLKLYSGAERDNVDLFLYVSKQKRIIILGGPGTGKTTLMKNLVISILVRRCSNTLNGTVPVFVSLRAVAKEQSSIKNAILSVLINHKFLRPESFINAHLLAGKLLIVLDGLDEVGTNREFVVAEILKFCAEDSQQENHNWILITCREHSYRTMDLRAEIADILRMEPFANHHMRTFLAGWPPFRGRVALNLYSDIQKDATIRDICRNPLMLTILTGLYLDTEKFSLPATRSQFYFDATDELLVQRPARRQIAQQFDEKLKRKILGRAALERLETVKINEDPEEITQEVLFRKAKEVFADASFDFNMLIRELIEVNGILKYSQEQNYNCAHRTILEYFAANEATVIRENWRVIATFSSRSELIQILFFYCGMLRNVPDLVSVIESLIRDKRWIEAAQCILNMAEPVGGGFVEQIVTNLLDAPSNAGDFSNRLELVASLASRPSTEFESARRAFSAEIDRLAASDDAGASALESSISASPEIALKIIPGLLLHSSKRWRSTAVQLLRDIGTDEAVDQLFELLKHQDDFVRTKAGLILANMIKTRNADMRERVALLNPKRDLFVWPLEQYFPGNIAIAIAESVKNSDKTGCESINYAVLAIQSREKFIKDVSLRAWTRIPLDIKLSRMRLIISSGIFSLGSILLLASVIFMLSMTIFTAITDQNVIILPKSPYIFKYDAAGFQNAVDRASALVRSIEEANAPSASGLLRVLPWNWLVHPALPAAQLNTFNLIKSWSLAEVSPSDLGQNESLPKNIADIKGGENPDDLIHDIRELSHVIGQSPKGDGIEFVYVGIQQFAVNVIAFTLILLGTLQVIYRKMSPINIDIRAFANSIPLFMLWNSLETKKLLSLYCKSWVLVEYFGVVIVFILLSMGLKRFRWPINPLLSLIDEVSPSELPRAATVPAIAGRWRSSTAPR